LAFGDLQQPKAVDALYLPALTEGMVEACSLFDAIFQTGTTYDHVVFNGLEAGEQDIPGAEYYRRELAALSDKFMPTKAATNTRMECDLLIEFAKQHSWENILIATVPYHWPRVMCSIVGSMTALEYRPRVYFLRPHHIDWHMAMSGSRGLVQTEHFTEAGEDGKRFLLYVERGQEQDGKFWLKQYGAPFAEIFRYLDWRDAQSE